MNVRNADLQILERQYAQPGSRAMLLYGSAQAGMSETALAFAKGQDYVYFCANPASEKEQLRLLAEASQTDAADDYDTLFASWRAASGKKILILDEVQHMIKKEGTLIPALQHLMEQKSYAGECFLLLLCSDVNWAAQDAADALAPLKKYWAETYLFREWRFVDVAQEFKDYPIDELIRLYGIFGGSYGYLQHVDKTLTVKENVIRLMLSKNGCLYSAAQDLLKSQLREVSVYDTILSAIAQGKEKLNDLFLTTGYSRAKISVYLKNLAELGLVEKVRSLETGGWENAKKGVYRIANPFLDFWFHFVYPHWSALYQLSPEAFYEKFITSGFDSYMEHYFAKVCTEYLQLMDEVEQLPLKIKKISTWIGKKGTIDIVAQNEARERIIAKCCWEKPEMGLKDLKELFDAAKEAKIKAEYYYLFTAGEFEAQLKEQAIHQQKIQLVDLTCF